MTFQTVARRTIELKEWVTPAGVVLTVTGDLDAMACRSVEQHLRRLVARWPGLLLTLDVEHVGRVDANAVEGLMLGVVAMRAGEARLAIAAAGGPCKAVLGRLGISPEPSSGGFTRWPAELGGMTAMWSGVTA